MAKRNKNKNNTNRHEQQIHQNPIGEYSGEDIASIIGNEGDDENESNDESDSNNDNDDSDAVQNPYLDDDITAAINDLMAAQPNDDDFEDLDTGDTDQPDMEQQVPNLAAAAKILKDHPEYIPRMTMYINQIVGSGGDPKIKDKWLEILNQFDIEDTLNTWNSRDNSRGSNGGSAGGNGSAGGSYNGANPGEGYNDWLGDNGTFEQMYGEPMIPKKGDRYAVNNIALPIMSTLSNTVGKSVGDYSSILGDAMHAMSGMDTKQADTYSQQAAKLNQNMMTGSMIDPGAYYSSLARNKINDASNKIKEGFDKKAKAAVANDIGANVGKALKDIAVVNNARDDAARNAQLMINEHPVGDYYRYLNGNESRTHRDLSQGGAQ